MLTSRLAERAFVRGVAKPLRRRRCWLATRASSTLVSKEDILRAREVVNGSPAVWATPLLEGVQLAGVDGTVALKLESLQHAGSFKIRGMVNLFHK